jgi:hypothetical protein
VVLTGPLLPAPRSRASSSAENTSRVATPTTSSTLWIDATLDPHRVLSCANGWKRCFFAEYYGLAYCRSPAYSGRTRITPEPACLRRAYRTLALA